MRGSVPPVTIPPRATPGTSSVLRARGWGFIYGGLVPGVGDGANKRKIASCTWFIKRNGDASLAGRKNKHYADNRKA